MGWGAKKKRNGIDLPPEEAEGEASGQAQAVVAPEALHHNRVEPVMKEKAAAKQSDTPAIDLDKLLVEVFTHTGRRLTADDPVVVAALVQSTLIRRAGVGV